VTHLLFLFLFFNYDFVFWFSFQYNMHLVGCVQFWSCSLILKCLCHFKKKGGRGALFSFSLGIE